jgi:hypothetical protein
MVREVRNEAICKYLRSQAMSSLTAINCLERKRCPKSYIGKFNLFFMFHSCSDPAATTEYFMLLINLSSYTMLYPASMSGSGGYLATTSVTIVPCFYNKLIGKHS